MSESPSRLQFTLTSLVISTSCIGAGIGCFLVGNLILSEQAHDALWWQKVLAVVQILGAGPLLGAGIFGPFRRARLGAYVGFFVPISAALSYFVIRFGWQPVWEDLVVRIVIVLTGFVIALAAFSVLRRTWQRRMQESSKAETPQT